MQHLHTEYERELVPLFVKVLGDYASGSKLENDTADRSQIVTDKLGAQLDEQLDLLFVEGLAVRPVIGLQTDASAIAATNSFNGVGTHEQHNVVPDGFSGNSESRTCVPLSCV